MKQSTSIYFFALICIILLSTGISASANPKEVLSKSGVRAWLVEDYSTDVIALRAEFDGGFALESPHKKGLALLVGYLLDEGAGNYDGAEYRKQLEESSTTISFESDFEKFAIMLRTTSSGLEKGAELLATSLRSPTYDNAAIERVKKQLVSWIEGKLSQPRSKADIIWGNLGFGQNILTKYPDDTREIPGIRKDDLRNFSNQQFQRQRLTVGLVGPINVMRAGKILDLIFGQLPLVEGKDVVPTVRNFGASVVSSNLIANQSFFTFGQLFLNLSSEQREVLHLAAAVLGATPYSRLPSSLRYQDSLVYAANVQFQDTHFGGIFYGRTSARSQDADQVVATIEREWSRITREGITFEEFERYKQNLSGAHLVSLDSSLSLAEDLASSQRRGILLSEWPNVHSLVGNLSYEEVQFLIKQTLSSTPLLISFVGIPARQ